METVCSLDDIIKMHWPSWQSCWWTEMGRKQAEVQHSSVAGQFLCQIYFLYCSKVVQGNFFFFFFTALDIHPSPEFFLISLHYSGGHLPSVCLCAESLLQWTADGRVQHFSAHQSWYLFNQQICALGCLYPVKLGLCLHISIRGGLHCNSAWSFHSTCSYAYFFICVRPDHHIATELHQFMLGEGPCRCCALQSAAKISPW